MQMVICNRLENKKDLTIKNYHLFTPPEKDRYIEFWPEFVGGLPSTMSV